MAFTFTPEDGTGLPTANSYVTVAEADDILFTNIHAFAAWDAKPLADKEKLLAWATRLIDTKAVWYGKKSYPTSALAWPRTGVKTREGIVLAEDEIPVRLKEAIAEYARFLIDTDRTASQGRDGLMSLKVDVIEMAFDKDYRIPPIPNVIWEALTDLGYLRTGAGAAKIIIV